MIREEFERMALADPQLAEPIRESAQSARAKQFGVLTEAAVIALMFPIAQFLLARIGLPWLSELGRYSEMQRQRVHECRWLRHRLTRYRVLVNGPACSCKPSRPS